MDDNVTRFASLPLQSQDATVFQFTTDLRDRPLHYLAVGEQRALALDILLEALREGSTPATAIEFALMEIGARKL